MTEREIILKALKRTGAKIVYFEPNGSYYEYKLKNSYEILTLQFDSKGFLISAET